MYKFFLVVLCVLGAVGVGFYLYRGNRGDELHIVVIKPEIVTIGVPFTLGVDVGNDVNVLLQDVRVALELPEEVAIVGSGMQKTVDAKNMGNIGIGGSNRADFRVIILSGENAVKQLTAVVEYVPQGVNSRFEKREVIDVVVGSPGMLLDVVAPERVVSGQEFALEVRYKNATEIDMNDLRLKIAYPAGFEMKSADLPPDIGGSVWQLGGLRRGSEMHFKIKGNLVGEAGASAEFKAQLEAGFDGGRYRVAEKAALAQLISSPLVLGATIDGESGVASVGEELHYRIAYENTADQGFRDAVVGVELKGDMFDFATLKTTGTIGPKGTTITWNRVTNPELVVISPKAEGIVEFTIATKKAYAIRRLSDRNFILKVDARIDSPTVAKDAVGDATTGFARLETKVGGAIVVDARAFFRDASAGLVNRGPFPPKSGVPTQYTIHWVLTNAATDGSDVNVTAVLPGGVAFTGATKIAQGGGTLTYMSNTQTVTWHIDRIPAGVGTIRQAFEAIFQIEATPSPNFVRQAMPLVGETTVKGKDDFTGLELEAYDVALTTALPDDPTVGSGGGLVIP